MITTTRAWASRSLGRAKHRPSYLRAQNAYRYNATKPTVKPEVADVPKTIPGPSWLWLEPIYTPFRAYGRVQQRRPYMTQFVSSLVIYFVGDIVAQSIQFELSSSVPKKEKESSQGEVPEGNIVDKIKDRDWARTARALLIGGLAAVPGYRWFLWLGNSFNYGSKTLSLTTKVVVNQIVFTPIFNSYFFGMQSLLTGCSPSEIFERIKNTVPTSWINSCKIWPAVTAFSFTFVPIQYRSIFGGVIAIGWQTYLSLLNQRAAAQEEFEHSVNDAQQSQIAGCERREKVRA